jgi:hypothetical protein
MFKTEFNHALAQFKNSEPMTLCDIEINVTNTNMKFHIDWHLYYNTYFTWKWSRTTIFFKKNNNCTKQWHMHQINLIKDYSFYLKHVWMWNIINEIEGDIIYAWNSAMIRERTI